MKELTFLHITRSTTRGVKLQLLITYLPLAIIRPNSNYGLKYTVSCTYWPVCTCMREIFIIDLIDISMSMFYECKWHVHDSFKTIFTEKNDTLQLFTTHRFVWSLTLYSQLLVSVIGELVTYVCCCCFSVVSSTVWRVNWRTFCSPQCHLYWSWLWTLCYTYSHGHVYTAKHRRSKKHWALCQSTWRHPIDLPEPCQCLSPPSLYNGGHFLYMEYGGSSTMMFLKQFFTLLQYSLT